MKKRLKRSSAPGFAVRKRPFTCVVLNPYSLLNKKTALGELSEMSKLAPSGSSQ